MSNKKQLTLLIICLFPFFTYAQNFPKYYQSNLIQVFDSTNSEYKNPFGGGLKFPVFAAFHLNKDNKEDLVILDKVDNRILTFINEGNMRFTYQPEYERFFPDSLVSFLLFKDYNNDGKPDLFTYSNVAGAGITVYKNFSNDLDGIKFKVASMQLQTYDWGNYQFSYNLPLFRVDIPSIVDVDQDGDLDIMVFDELGGSWLKLYNNMSVELCGNPDALIYTCIDHYWGEFHESDLTNEVTLNQQYIWGYRYYNQNYDSLKNVWDLDSLCNPEINSRPDRIKENSNKRADRHIGSTIFAHDLDADEDLDLLVGDIGFPGVLMLENGKSDSNFTNNRIISNHLNFPPTSKAVDIPQMPACYYIDVNVDGVKDMIFAPFDMDEIDTFKNLNQVWLYLNEGENNNLDLKFEQNDFLQAEMLDLGGATSPAFCDYDRDGDQDLFVVTSGDFYETYHQSDRLVLYENIGNVDTAIFKFKDYNYLNLMASNYKGLKPAFTDVDSDGDQDLFFGRINGKLLFFENKADTGQIADFQLVSNNYQSIDVGDYSAPAFADLNQDSLVDMIIGEKKGVIYYYKNTGSKTNPLFTLESSNLGNIDYPANEVYLSPALADLDSNGYLDLVIGAQIFELFFQYKGGKVYFYPDINKNLAATFTARDSVILDREAKNPILKSQGGNLSPALANLDGDGIPDLICGLSRGGLLLYNTNISLFTIITANKGLTICPGDSITLDAGSGFDAYEWNTGQETQKITVDSAFTYSCKVTKGIVSFTAYITVSVHTGILDAEFDYEINEREVDFSLKNQQIHSIYWDFGDGEYSFEENPKHRFIQQGNYTVCMSVSDICGAKDRECKNIFVQSSMKELEEIEWRIFPNPFSNYVFIEVDGKYSSNVEIQVLDVIGKVKLSREFTINSTQYLDLTKLSPGMYFVRLIDEQEKIRGIEKIMKY